MKEKGKILSDREKLELWDSICQKKDWSKPRELDAWLAKHGVYFTNAGSCVNLGPLIYRLENVNNTKVVVNSSKDHELATFVMQALSGILIFSDIEVEREFWSLTRERLKDEFDQDLPKEIVPKYHRAEVFVENKKSDDKIDPEDLEES